MIREHNLSAWPPKLHTIWPFWSQRSYFVLNTHLLFTPTQISFFFIMISPFWETFAFCLISIKIPFFSAHSLFSKVKSYLSFTPRFKSHFLRKALFNLCWPWNNKHDTRKFFCYIFFEVLFSQHKIAFCLSISKLISCIYWIEYKQILLFTFTWRFSFYTKVYK